MIKTVSDQALPYTLSTDKAEVKTVFHIKCLTADAHQRYISKYVAEQNNAEASTNGKAKALVLADRETLQGCIESVDNAYTEGVSLTSKEDIAKLLHAVDWPSLQELLRAAQSMAILDTDTKNA